MIRLVEVDKIHDPDGPGRFAALAGVDFAVSAGEFVVIHGASGSGKTTLLSLVGGLIRPTRGEVVVAGRAIAKLPDRHASAFRLATVGFVFQDRLLLPQFSVRDNVALPLVATGADPERIRTLTTTALELADILHRADRPARDLSGGEKQRCAIARAVVGDPALLLCDEPTANLDAAARDQLLDLLAALKQRGKTILVATHDPVFTGLGCVDRRLELEAGRIVPS